MPKFLALPVAALFAAIGIVFNSVLRVPIPFAEPRLARFVCVVFGQLCWGVAMLICIIRGNIYANAKISFDGPGIAIFGTIKWGLVTLFLLADAFVLERAWEEVFILP